MLKPYVVIPYKGTGAKSRLVRDKGGFLYPEEVTSLSLAMLVDTYQCWERAIGDAGYLIVGVANEYSPTTFSERDIVSREMPSGDINESLHQLRLEARGKGYNIFGVSGGDLPLAIPDDFRELLLLSHQVPVVFSVGKRGGTTAYAISGDYDIELHRPGITNLENQEARLEEMGLAYTTVHNPRLFCDVDTSSDLLEAWFLLNVNPELYADKKTYRCLLELIPRVMEEETQRGDTIRRLYASFL